MTSFKLQNSCKGPNHLDPTGHGSIFDADSHREHRPEDAYSLARAISLRRRGSRVRASRLSGCLIVVDYKRRNLNCRGIGQRVIRLASNVTRTEESSSNATARQKYHDEK
jgi:hypothetical protein